MAIITSGLFLVALLFTAQSQPLGETTVCESAPNVLPNIGLGVGPMGLNLPPSLLLQLMTQTLVPGLGSATALPLPGLGSTTLCNSQPNFGLPLVSGLPVPGQTTVCESASNLPALPLPYANLPLSLLPLLSNYGLPVPGQTTVCESATNLPALPFPFPYPNLPGLLSNLPVPVPGSTTVIESMPNGLGLSGLGLPYGRQFGRLPFGLPMNGLGLVV